MHAMQVALDADGKQVFIPKVVVPFGKT